MSNTSENKIEHFAFPVWYEHFYEKTFMKTMEKNWKYGMNRKEYYEKEENEEYTMPDVASGVMWDTLNDLADEEWRCLKCGAIHSFGRNGKLKAVYRKVTNEKDWFWADKEKK